MAKQYILLQRHLSALSDINIFQKQKNRGRRPEC